MVNNYNVALFFAIVFAQLKSCYCLDFSDGDLNPVFGFIFYNIVLGFCAVLYQLGGVILPSIFLLSLLVLRCTAIHTMHSAMCKPLRSQSVAGSAVGRRSGDLLALSSSFNASWTLDDLNERLRSLQEANSYLARKWLFKCMMNWPDDASKINTLLDCCGGEAILFPYGRTLSGHAAQTGCVHVLKWMVKNDQSISVGGKNLTSLQIAIQCKKLNIIQYLLEDISAEDRIGDLFADKIGHHPIINSIVALGDAGCVRNLLNAAPKEFLVRHVRGLAGMPALQKADTE